MRFLIMLFPPVLALAVLLVLQPRALHADTKMEVWAMIRDGKVDEVLSRLAVADLTEQRSAFGAFVTSDPAVDKFSAQLLVDNPDDPLAMTARAWALYKQGWAMRGTGYGRTVYPEASKRLRALHEQAMALARAALAKDPTLIPASDLLLNLARTLDQNELVPPEFTRVMEMRPNRQTLLLAASALSPAWGGSVEFGLQACDDWAGRITDTDGYTPEFCKLDMIFNANYPKELRDQNADAPRADDTPLLDNVRLHWATSGLWSDEISLEVLKRVGPRTAPTTRQFSKWDSLEGNQDPFTLGPRARKALSAEIETMRQRLDFDPGDNFALMFYIDDLQSREQIDQTPMPWDEIKSRFAALFAVAPYDPNAWQKYAMVYANTGSRETMSLADFDRNRGYWINAVHYSNHDPEQLRWLDAFNREVWDLLDKRNLDAMDATGEPEFGRDAFNASVICPTIRTIRLIEAVCEGRDDGNFGCTKYPPGADPRPELIARAQKRDACTAEFAADPVELAYDAIPVEVPTAP